MDLKINLLRGYIQDSAGQWRALVNMVMKLRVL
jgi:hypothetical protein